MWKVNRIVFITGLLGVTLTAADGIGSITRSRRCPLQRGTDLEPQRAFPLTSPAPPPPPSQRATTGSIPSAP